MRGSTTGHDKIFCALQCLVSLYMLDSVVGNPDFLVFSSGFVEPLCNHLLVLELYIASVKFVFAVGFENEHEFPIILKQKLNLGTVVFHYTQKFARVALKCFG